MLATPRQRALVVCLAGLLVVDLAVLTPLVTGTPGVLRLPLLLGIPLLVVAGAMLFLLPELAHRRWVLGGFLVAALVLLGYGWYLLDSLGEFSSLAGAVVLMLALAAYMAFLATVAWGLASAGKRWPQLLAGLAGLSVLAGLGLMPRSGGVGGDTIALLLVGAPLVLLTVAVAVLLWATRRAGVAA